MVGSGFSELSVLGGFMAGLASSLHCVGMCGGIATGLTLSFAPEGSASERARVLMLAQAGRVLAYILAGAMLGALGSQLYFSFDRSEAHIFLRWVGAMMLVYIGLSVAGWAPSLAGLDRIGTRIATGINRPFQGALKHAGPILAGLLWGFLPCGMVYAALLYAMLSGDGVQGGAIMTGFGLGTLPAVTAAAFGASHLTHWARSPRSRTIIGLSIAVIGVTSVAVPWRAVALYCGIPVN